MLLGTNCIVCGKKLTPGETEEIWGTNLQHALAGNIEEDMIFVGCKECYIPIDSLDIRIIMYTGLGKTRWEYEIPNRDKLNSFYKAMTLIFEDQWTQGEKHRERADETPEPEPEPEPATFPIICLCGSTKFKDDFEKIKTELTLQGNLVLSVVFYGLSSTDRTANLRVQEKKEMLDQIHLQKIRMSDTIYVINRGGYIGDSTRREIEYAKSLGKTIQYMEEPDGTI